MHPLRSRRVAGLVVVVVVLGACTASRPAEDPRTPFDVDDPRARSEAAARDGATEGGGPEAAPPPQEEGVLGWFEVDEATGDGRFLGSRVGEGGRAEERRGALVLAPGDIVVAVDGRVLNNADELRQLWADLPDSQPAAANRRPRAVLWVAGRLEPEPIPYTHFGVALKITTFGPGVDVAVPLSRRLNLRLGFSTFTYDREFDELEDKGIELSGELRLQAFGAHLDIFPFGGSLRLSPGVVLYNGNRVSALAHVPGGTTFELGDLVLMSEPTDPVRGTGSVEFERAAPAIALGWGNIVPRGHRRWSIPIEVGVVFSRAPRADLALGGTACMDGVCLPIGTEPRLQVEVLKEEIEIDALLAPYELLPIVSIGFGYKF